MALNWDLTQIKNSETLCWTPSKEEEGKFQMHGVTEVLIWSTMLVGFSKITEKNYKDFHRRLIEWEVVAGGMLMFWEKDKETPSNRMPTLQEVQAHIGLTTNASTKTNRQWTANLGTQVKEEASRQIRKEIEQIRIDAEKEKEDLDKARGNLVNAIMEQDNVDEMISTSV